MLIEGTIRSNKTELLIDRYVELIDGGVSSDEILVICLNAYKKKIFIDSVLEKTVVDILGRLNVFTFFGLCYNATLDNWAFLENTLNSGNTKIQPNLCGLALSQNIWLNSIGDNYFCDYFSRKSF